jgi:hypothetical protein
MGLVREPPRRVHALPEPGDDGPPLELDDLAIIDLRDEQPRGVGADVDDGDGRQSSSSVTRSTGRARTAALAPHDNRPLHQLGVLGHERDGLVVTDLAIAEPELRVDRLARARNSSLAGLPVLRTSSRISPAESGSTWKSTRSKSIPRSSSRTARFLHVVQVRFS